MSGRVKRTTVRLDDALLHRAKAEAARRGSTLTQLIEEGLHLLLAQARPAPRRARIQLPVSSKAGGTLPGIDLNDGAALLDLLGGRR